MITGLRMNHAYIRPGGVAQDLPEGAIEKIRDWSSRISARSWPASTSCCAASRSGSTGSRTSAGSASRAASPSASPARCCAPPACRGTCARPSPYLGYETFDFEVPTDDRGDCWARFVVRVAEMHESLKIVEQVLDRLEPGPMMVDDPKIAWPAKLSLGPDGMGNSLEHVQKIMGTSMESLIHHFKLVTEGFRVPAGQVYTRGRVAPRRARCAHRQRRRHPAVPRALARAVLHQPAGAPRRCRSAAWSPTSSPRCLDRPRHGWVRPMTQLEMTLPPSGDRQLPHVGDRSSTAPGDPSASSATQTRAEAARDHRALPGRAGALGAAADAAPGAVGAGLRHPRRHRVLRRDARPHQGPGRRGRDVLHDVQAHARPASTWSASAPTRCAGCSAATRSSPRCRRTSASATTRPPPTARSPSSTPSAWPPATTRRSSPSTTSSSTTRRSSRRRSWCDQLRAGERPLPTRGAPLCSFKQIERQIAGFFDDEAAWPWTPTAPACRPSSACGSRSSAARPRRPTPRIDGSRRADAERDRGARAPPAQRPPARHDAPLPTAESDDRRTPGRPRAKEELTCR